MEKIKEDLMSFVKQSSDKNHRSILDTINKLRLGFVFDEELPFGKEKVSVLARRLYQKRMNKIYLDELEKIYKRCKNTKVLVFKGIAHAFLFYSKFDLRLFDDMDLFVKMDDCEKLDKILTEIGYVKYENRVIGREDNIGWLYKGDLYANFELSGNGRIDNYTKNHEVYIKSINGLNIKIELHAFLLPPIKYPYINYDDIFLKSRKIHVPNGKVIHTLSFEDVLICSACHLCKHISAAVIRPEPSLNNIDMKSIIDIKLMIEQNKFLWNDIILKAKKWQVLGDLLLTIKVINYIFPDTIDNKTVNKMHEIVSDIEEKRSHEALINGISLLNSEDIFYFNFANFFKKETIDKLSPCYLVSKCIEKSEKICIKDTDALFTINPYWNKKCFGIILQFPNDVNKIDNIVYSLTIGSQISYLYAQTFFITKNETETQLSSSYANVKNEKFDESSLNKIKYELQCNQLIIEVLWNNLNIFPRIGDVLPFNFKILLFDKNKKLKKLYSLTKQNYYNDYGTQSIILKE